MRATRRTHAFALVMALALSFPTAAVADLGDCGLPCERIDGWTITRLPEASRNGTNPWIDRISLSPHRIAWAPNSSRAQILTYDGQEVLEIQGFPFWVGGTALLYLTYDGPERVMMFDPLDGPGPMQVDVPCFQMFESAAAASDSARFLVSCSTQPLEQPTVFFIDSGFVVGSTPHPTSPEDLFRFVEDLRAAGFASDHFRMEDGSLLFGRVLGVSDGNVLLRRLGLDVNPAPDLWFSDGTDGRQVTTHLTAHARLYRDRVTWSGGVPQLAPGEFEIFTWQDGVTTQLTDDPTIDAWPISAGGDITWVTHPRTGSSSSNNLLLRFDGLETRELLPSAFRELRDPWLTNFVVGRRIRAAGSSIAWVWGSQDTLVLATEDRPGSPPAPQAITADLTGRQKLELSGYGRVQDPLSMAVHLGRGTWTADAGLGGTLSGTWTAKGRNGAKRQLFLDDASQLALLQQLDEAASFVAGVPVDTQLNGYAITAKTKKKDQVQIKIKAAFTAMVGGELRKGKYQAKLKGAAR